MLLRGGLFLVALMLGLGTAGPSFAQRARSQPPPAPATATGAEDRGVADRSPEVGSIQAGERPPATANSDQAGRSARREALDWLEQYRLRQVLFDEGDFQRLEQRLADGSDQQAQQWLRQTAAAREVLASPQWTSTRDWLREFLAVQAIYSDQQIGQWRQEAMEAFDSSPRDFLAVLLRIEDMRWRLVRESASAEQLRRQRSELFASYLREGAQERNMFHQPSTMGSGPGWSSSPAYQVQPRQYQRPPALISSGQVARWYVWGSLFYGW